MSSYDHLKRMAEQAAANGQKAFSAETYRSASAPLKEQMDAIANRKAN